MYLILSFLWTVGPLEANSSINDLSQKVVELRSEVESLNSELLLLRETQQNQIRDLGGQISQTAAQVTLEENQIEGLKAQLRPLKEKNSQSKSTEFLHDFLSQRIDQLSVIIKSGPPFQKEKRLQELKELQQKLVSASLPPIKVLGRLWSFIEDEKRLSKSIGVSRQNLTIKGQIKLATVVRLGMFGLFFKTEENRFGWARKSKESSQGFIFEYDDSAEFKKSVTLLMDGIKSGKRQGNYLVPPLFKLSSVQNSSL